MVASADNDGDGSSNLEEFIGHSNPADKYSGFEVYSVSIPNLNLPQQWILTWESFPDRLYKIYSSSSLATPWPTSPIYTVEGDGQQKAFTNNSVVPGPHFYRIHAELMTSP
jgi:hypothetical protein